MWTQTLGRDAEEDGIALIFVALSLTALLIVAALFIDGGNSYSVRRSMQNASDAGAMAGALAMYRAMVNGSMSAGGVTDVYQQAYIQAITNDGGSLPSNGDDFCDFVDTTGSPVGMCASTGSLPGTAVGVKVTVENRRSAFFGSFAGQSTLGLRASAAATIQALGGTGAPWIICADTANSGWNILSDSSAGGAETEGSTDTGADLDDQVRSYTAGTPTGYPGLVTLLGWNGTDRTNAPTNNQSDPRAPMLIQGPGGNAKCGSGSSSADGKGSGATLTNGMLAVTTGNGSSKVTNTNVSQPVGTCYTTITGTPSVVTHVPCSPCPTGTYNTEADFFAATANGSSCDVLLPLSDWGIDNGHGATYHVVAEAAFHLEQGNGSDKVIGWIDDPSGFKLTSGFTQAGSCNPATSLCAVKLTDFPSNGLLE